MPVQLSPVHFLRLMDVAERRVMLKGNDLNQEGRPHEEVFLIVEGTAEVREFFRVFPPKRRCVDICYANLKQTTC